MKNTPQQLHIPVLLDAVLDMLKPTEHQHFLDLTAGYGGHARSVIARIGDANLATLVDRDGSAILSLEDLARAGASLIHADFLTAAEKLAKENKQFDMILLDLGVSSPQLDTAERGFSFSKSAPLDMRMDTSQSLTAAAIVNGYSEKELSKIFVEYGEENRRLADKFAREILWQRKKKPIASTSELAELVRIETGRADGGKYHKIHPATKVFQALRIAVNDELGQLERTLPLLPRLMKPGGRLAIISFHSLEDRIVKNFLKNEAENGFESELHILTRHPIKGATIDENNPRARSAKLRAAAKINNERTCLCQSKS
jgi:16S rRNA (cytosine1402-N4)-methyltransferase